MNLIDAGYWTSPEQCEAADYIRQLQGKLAKAELQLEYMETIRRENALYFEKREQKLVNVLKECKETLLSCEAALVHDNAEWIHIPSEDKEITLP